MGFFSKLFNGNNAQKTEEITKLQKQVNELNAMVKVLKEKNQNLANLCHKMFSEGIDAMNESTKKEETIGVQNDIIKYLNEVVEYTKKDISKSSSIETNYPDNPKLIEISGDTDVYTLDNI